MPSPEAHVVARFTRLIVKRPLSHRPIDIARARRLLASRAWFPTMMPAGVRVEPSGDPLLRGEWLVPTDVAPRRTILYLHGGGYVACSPRTHRALTSWIAARARARVFALDYRLAPEHPFPAALDDAVSAVRALYAQGVDPHALGIAGDSAGGGLALATLVALREAGDRLPGAAALLSPWTDLAGTGASIRDNAATDDLLPAHLVSEAGLFYAGDQPMEHPLISPLYADLHGLPSLLVHASDAEILLDDARRMVDKARDAHVAVEFEVWHRMLHAWQVAVPWTRESRAAVAGIGSYFARRIG